MLQVLRLTTMRFVYVCGSYFWLVAVLLPEGVESVRFLQCVLSARQWPRLTLPKWLKETKRTKCISWWKHLILFAGQENSTIINTRHSARELSSLCLILRQQQQLFFFAVAKQIFFLFFFFSSFCTFLPYLLPAAPYKDFSHFGSIYIKVK